MPPTHNCFLPLSELIMSVWSTAASMWFCWLKEPVWTSPEGRNDLDLGNALRNCANRQRELRLGQLPWATRWSQIRTEPYALTYTDESVGTAQFSTCSGLEPIYSKFPERSPSKNRLTLPLNHSLTLTHNAHFCTQDIQVLLHSLFRTPSFCILYLSHRYPTASVQQLHFFACH